MKSRTNMKNIQEIMFKLEDEFDLFNKKIDDVYFWKLIRFPIADKIFEHSDLVGKAHPDYTKSNSFIKNIFRLLYEDYVKLKYNALNISESKEIIVFNSFRKREINGRRDDVHTFFLKEYLSLSRPIGFLELESNTYDIDYCKNNNSRIASPLNFMRIVKRITKRNDILDNEKNFLNLLADRILKEFNISINIRDLAQKAINEYKIQYVYYNKLFNKICPTRIFIICSYGLEALISAAKDNDIKVYEFQHGTMSKYHLGYSFPQYTRIPYFPDYLLSYGEYWSDITPLPIKKENIYPIGYSYLKQRLNEFKHIIPSENCVLFISQGTIGEKLSEFAFEFALKNIEYNIIYKLHPNESKQWRKNYPILTEAIKLANFNLEEDTSSDLHELLSIAKFQVGVYSTAIYEGLALGKKTILVNLPGIEEMESLINEKVVMLVENTDELSYNLKHFNSKAYEPQYFFNEKFEYKDLFLY